MLAQRVFLTLIPLLLGCGCAGPSTPFGAIHSLWPDNSKISPKVSETVANHTPVIKEFSPEIKFTPKRQKFHNQSKFGIHILDPSGFENEHELQILHNGTDVTNSFLRRAKKTFSKTKTQMNLMFSHFTPESGQRPQN